MDNSNLLDKAIGYLAPEWALARTVARIKTDMIAKYDQFTAGRDRQLVSSMTTTEENEVNKYDRFMMINAFRRLRRGNPIVAGIVNTFTTNVVGPYGSRPLPNTGNPDLNRRMQDYFLNWAESAELRGVVDYWNYQKILLATVMLECDAGTVMTSTGQLQGIEPDRIQTPQKYASVENYSMFQGVQVNPDTHVPERYWIVNRARNGYGWDHSSAVGVPAYNFIHTFRCERFTQQRGLSALFAAYDWISDLDEICDYVKFAFKVQSVFAVFLKGAADSDGSLKPGLKGQKNTDLSSDKKIVIDLDKGAVIDGRKIGAESVQTISPNAAGPQFEQFAKFLASMIGLPLGIPVDFVLLKLHDGNYSSQRLALRITYKTFMEWWTILTAFNRRVYRWKMWQAVNSGKIKIPDAQRYTFLNCNWSRPVPESADPEKENKASLDAIAGGLSDLPAECAARGSDWLEVENHNKAALERYLADGLPWLVGTSPGILTVQDLNATVEQKQALAAKYRSGN